MSKRAADNYLIRDGPEDPAGMSDGSGGPTRATAAQLANRKIKSMTRRRQGSPASGSPQPSFNPNSTPTNFGFGSSQPATTNNGVAFGGLATSSHAAQSFPPTNGAAPSNTMTSSQSFGGFNGSGGFGAGPNNNAFGSNNGFGSNSFTSSAGGFSFGGSTQPANNPFASLQPSTTNGGGQSSTPSFNFGASTSAPSPTFGGLSASTSAPSPTFGGISAFTSTPAFGASTTTAAPQSTFTFGSSATKPVDAPSQSNNMFSSKFAPATTSSGFTFGASPATASPATPAASEQKPLFAFGNSTSTPPTTTSAGFSFGTTSSPTATTSNSTPKPAFAFGTPSASPAPAPATPETAQKPLFSFGNSQSESTSKPDEPAQSTPSAFGTPSGPKSNGSVQTGFSFGTSAPSTPAASTTQNESPGGIFGFGANTPTESSTKATPKPIFNFGNGTPSQAASSASVPATASPAKPSFSFGQSASSPAAPAAPSQQPTPDVSQSKPTTLFGQSKPSTSTPPTPTAVSQAPPSTTKASHATPAINPTASGTLQTSSYKPANVTGYASAEFMDAVLNEDAIRIPESVTDPKDRAIILRDTKILRLNQLMQNVLEGLQGNTPHILNLCPQFLAYVEGFEKISQQYQTAVGSEKGAYVPAPEALKRKATAVADDNNKPSTSQPVMGTSTPSKWAPSSLQSESAKKFGAFLNESPAKANEKPSEDQSTTPPTSPVKANIFAAAGSTPFKLTNASSTPNTSGFKPSFPSALNGNSTQPSGFTPTSAAKPPTFKINGGNGGTNFLAQFGQKAALTAEEEKKKRKAEDFDSDEDDEEEWERKYEEEQKAKKMRFEKDHAKLKAPPAFALKHATDKNNDLGQVMSRSVSPASSVLDGPRPATGFGLFSTLSDAGSKDDDDDAEDEDNNTLKPTTNGNAGRSLFDRVSPRESPTPSDTQESNPGDHTWKTSTPIKFASNGITTPSTAINTAAPPKFNFSAPSSAPPKSDNANSLFGPSKIGAAAPFSFGKSLAPPSGTSSPFTSVDTSRASTPIGSDAGSNAGTEEAEETTVPNEPSSDLVNFEAAKAGHDVVFEAQRAKCYVFEPNVDKRPDDKKGVAWVSSGQGPLAVLKNQTTGVASILMKTSPGGKVVINTRLDVQFKYEPVAKRAKISAFVDGQIKSLLIQFGSVDLANAFVEACDQNKAFKET